MYEGNSIVLAGKDTLLLSPSNTINKYNGFYYILPNEISDPDLLTMEPCFMYVSPTIFQLVS